MTIAVECPHCRARMKFPDEMAGCPGGCGCGARFHVPGFQRVTEVSALAPKPKRRVHGCLLMALGALGLVFFQAFLGRTQRPREEAPHQKMTAGLVATLDNTNPSQEVNVSGHWQIQWSSESNDLRIVLEESPFDMSRRWTVRDFHDPDLSGSDLPPCPWIEQTGPSTITFNRGGSFRITGVPAARDVPNQLLYENWNIEISNIP